MNVAELFPAGHAVAIEPTALAAIRRGQQPPTQDTDFELVEGVAVIPIMGPLLAGTGGVLASLGMATGIDRIKLAVRSAIEDSQVSAVLLHVNSSGGTVQGLFPLAAMIRGGRQAKQITALVNYSAFSAAYALAAASNEVVLASETAGVGSIGVLGQHVSEAGALEQAGIEVTELVAGRRKADLSANRALNDRGRSSIQTEVDRIYDLLTTDIGASRPRLGREGAAKTEAGLFFGGDAVNAGLADRIATPEAVLQQLIQSTETDNAIR